MGNTCRPAKRVKKELLSRHLETEGEGNLHEEELEHGSRKMEIFQYDGIFTRCLDPLEIPLPPYIKEQLDDKSATRQCIRKSALLLRQLAFTSRKGSYSWRRQGVQIEFITLRRPWTGFALWVAMKWKNIICMQSLSNVRKKRLQP